MKPDTNFYRKTGKLKTPFVVYNLEFIKQNFLDIRKFFPDVEIYYAMKCNPIQRILKILMQLDSGFEVSSEWEVEQLLKLGVKASKIICLHPIKSPEFLKYLYKSNIEIMAVDSYEEVDKISIYAPGSKVVPRVNVSNEGSVWALNGKYGIDSVEFPKLFHYIASKGLIPYGLTFHVGSQCETLSSWVKALEVCKGVWDKSAKEGIKLHLLSLGGGLPIKYRKEVPTIEEIGNLITNILKKNFTSDVPVRFTIEPGRGLVANSAVLVSSVFGIATRGLKNWAYIETGSYNGLAEATETPDRRFYELMVEETSRELIKYNIGGPTCVSLDTPFEDVYLPRLEVGGRIYIINAGAYSATCSAPFNGFPVPKVYFYNEL